MKAEFMSNVSEDAAKKTESQVCLMCVLWYLLVVETLPASYDHAMSPTVKSTVSHGMFMCLYAELSG